MFEYELPFTVPWSHLQLWDGRSPSFLEALFWLRLLLWMNQVQVHHNILNGKTVKLSNCESVKWQEMKCHSIFTDSVSPVSNVGSSGSNSCIGCLNYQCDKRINWRLIDTFWIDVKLWQQKVHENVLYQLSTMWSVLSSAR